MDRAGIHAQREKPDITGYSKMIKILKNNTIKALIESILNSVPSCCSKNSIRVERFQWWFNPHPSWI